MHEQIQKILFNPSLGKIATIFIVIIWLIITAIQKNFFSKIKYHDNPISM